MYNFNIIINFERGIEMTGSFYYDKFKLISDLQHLFAKKEERGVYQSEALIRNEKASAAWGFELFLLRLLQQNTLSENQRSIAQLHRLWDVFQKQEQPSFTLEKLQELGWIRKILNTYELPFELFRIVGKTTKFSSLGKFLKRLNEQPYDEERKLFISCELFRQIYYTHHEIYPAIPAIETIQEMLGLIEEQGNLIFDIRVFNFNGVRDWLLTKLWSERHYGPEDNLERIKWWLDYKKLIGHSRLQSLHETDKLDFQEAVFALIGEEQDLWAVEQEIQQVSALMQAKWGDDVYLEHANIDFNVEEGLLAYLDYFARGDYSHIDSSRYILFELAEIALKDAEYEETLAFFTCALESPFLTRKIVKSTNYIPILLSNLATLKLGIYSYMQLEKQEALDKCLDLIFQTIKTSDCREVSKQLIEILLYLKKNALKERAKEKYARFFTAFYKILQRDKQYWHVLYPGLIFEIKQLFSRQKHTIESPLFWISLNLFKENEEDREIAQFIAKSYITTFDEEQKCAYFSPLIENEMKKYHWSKLIELLSTTKKNLLLMPFDIEQSVGEERIKYMAWTRYHLQFLSYLSVDVENVTLKSRIDGNLAELLETLATHKELNLFEKQIAMYKFSQPASYSLFENIWRAIDSFSATQKGAYLDELQQVNASFEYLATGVKVLSLPADRERLIQSITNINADKALEDFYFTDDIQRNVEQLLQTGLPELAVQARPLIEFCLTRGQERKQHDLLEWAFSSQLRMLYLMEQDNAVFAIEIPEVDEKKKLVDSKRFYEALVYLKSDELEKVSVAATIFESLIEQSGFNIGYKINRFSALIRQVELGGEQDVLIAKIVTMAYSLERGITDKQSMEYRLYMENLLYYYMLVEDFNAFLKRYNALEDDLKSSHAIMVFAIQVCIEMARYTEANTIFDELVAVYGESEFLEQLKQDIEGKVNTIHELPSTDINAQLPWWRIGEALRTFQGSSVNHQAQMYFLNESATKHDVIAFEVFHAVRAMKSLAPILNYYEEQKAKQGYEDDYNNLFCEVLNQRVRFYGWTCSTQSRGGYAKKSIGERDIVIYQKERIIAIIEAMRLETADKNNMMTHVKKTFSYDAEGANFYFLILWGFGENPEILFEKYCSHIRTWNEGTMAILRESRPQSVFNIELEDFPSRAICTHHQTTLKEEILMTHIYIDVKQQSLRQEH